jgi:hypothetical protein
MRPRESRAYQGNAVGARLILGPATVLGAVRAAQRPSARSATTSNSRSERPNACGEGRGAEGDQGHASVHRLTACPFALKADDEAEQRREQYAPDEFEFQYPIHYVPC